MYRRRRQLNAAPSNDETLGKHLSARCANNFCAFQAPTQMGRPISTPPLQQRAAKATTSDRSSPHLAPEVHVVAVLDQPGQDHHGQLRLDRPDRPGLRNKQKHQSHATTQSASRPTPPRLPASPFCHDGGWTECARETRPREGAETLSCRKIPGKFKGERPKNVWSSSFDLAFELSCNRVNNAMSDCARLVGGTLGCGLSDTPPHLHHLLQEAFPAVWVVPLCQLRHQIRHLC